jgi:NAD(P)-dependent dehydrogenase (short-subunit alcohol dehydrogenase family)
MIRKFEKSVALVTGGSSGIGRASAMAFAREGAKVVVADISVAGGEQTVQMIRKAGGEAIFLKTDVSRAFEVEELVEKTVETYGQLDFGHNNAGVGGMIATTAQCTEKNWDHVMSTNLKGVWLCMKYEIPQMLKRGYGAIVNTSSYLGQRGSGVGLSVYTASKHGVVGLTKAAALEYAGTGIRINTVCVGSIELTPMSQGFINEAPEKFRDNPATRPPIGRMGTLNEIAETVIWLCSDSASFVTGYALAVDGGRSAL